MNRATDLARAAARQRVAGLSGAVLLGGASSRMGRDKAALAVAGVAGATRIALALDALCDEVLLVGGTPPADAKGRAVADPAGPRCALRGLVAALEAARGERVLVVATDLPLLTDVFLRGLATAAGADAVVPRPASKAQPLCAVYRRLPVLARAREQLAAGELALHGLLDTLRVTWIEGERLRALDPAGTALLNVNTPEDLVRAEALLRSQAGRPGADAASD
jgi:molybdopterin-guanine dinucleotide biosynthesis protein A